MKDEEIKYSLMSRTGVKFTKGAKEYTLHDYQQKAKDDIFNSWDEVNYVMLQMPTGTGKTFLFSSIMSDINAWSMANHTPVKMLVIAHRKELIDQIDRSLNDFHVPHTVYAGPRESRILNRPVLVSSIQTITHQANEKDVKWLQDRIKFIVIDEAHHAMANTYRALWKMFPNARILGVTATPWRMGKEGFTRIFNRLILTQSVKKFIQQGYLAAYKYYSLKPESQIQHTIDSIREYDSFGDYKESAMMDKMDIGRIRAQLVKSYKKLAFGKKGIIYSINKKHSKNICEDFKHIGVRIIDIDDSTPKTERDKYVQDFKDGKIDIIVNVNIFSEGFDCPDIEFIQLARPTRSLTMYLQQVGRGLRTTDDKAACIILDNVGMYSRFGLPDANRQWNRHFRGDSTVHAPKRGTEVGNGGGWGIYQEPDMSEGDEEMELIQEANSSLSEDDVITTEVAEEQAEYKKPVSSIPHSIFEMSHEIMNNIMLVLSEDKRRLIKCRDIASGEIHIPHGVVEIAKDAFDKCKKVTDIIIPPTVEKIEDWAFWGTDCQMIQIPRSVKEIGATICRCIIFVDEENPYFVEKDGCLYTKDQKTLVMCPENIAGNEFKVPENVETIADSAFFLNEFDKIVLPQNLKRLDNYAISNIDTIDKIVIPKHIRYIGSEVFEGCSYLKDIFLLFNSYQPTIEEDAFNGFNKADCTLHVLESQINSFKSNPIYDGFKEILPISLIGNSKQASSVPNGVKLFPVKAVKSVDAIITNIGGLLNHKYKIVANNSAYYLHSTQSGNNYYLRPVFRRPTAQDNIVFREQCINGIVQFMLVHHIDETKDNVVIGSIVFENGYVTLKQTIGERTVSKSFVVK